MPYGEFFRYLFIPILLTILTPAISIIKMPMIPSNKKNKSTFRPVHLDLK